MLRRQYGGLIKERLKELKMLILAIIPVFTLMALSDFPGLIRDRKTKELTILAVLYIAVFILVFLMTLGITIPSPIKWIRDLIIDDLKIGYNY